MQWAGEAVRHDGAGLAEFNVVLVVIYVERSVSDAISSTGLRDFSFKDVTCTKTALRVLDDKVAATFLSVKDDGLLN